MKNLLILATCLAALAAGGVYADNDSQSKGAQGGDRKERMQRMREHLDLSDAQVEQMREIRESGGSREEMRAVLTEDQQAKFDAARQRHRQKHEHRAAQEG